MSDPAVPDSSTAGTSPVEPLAVDGVAAAFGGTIAWMLAEVVLLLVRLPAERHWWRLVPVAGVGFGLLGLAYTTRRRAAYRRAQNESKPNSSINGSMTGPDGDSATTSE